MADPVTPDDVTAMPEIQVGDWVNFEAIDEDIDVVIALNRQGAKTLCGRFIHKSSDGPVEIRGTRNGQPFVWRKDGAR